MTEPFVTTNGSIAAAVSQGDAGHKEPQKKSTMFASLLKEAEEYEMPTDEEIAEADRIRDELKAMGIELTDVKDGAVWKRA